jgi:uncharacterized protein (TIGR02757 family)
MKNFLDAHVSLINTPEFIDHDPVQFPRRYTKKQDIEIVAFLTAIISWGQRRTILNDAERMLKKLGDSPYNYIMNREYEQLGSANIHRTFFEPDLLYILKGFRLILENYDSIEDFIIASIPDIQSASAWDIVQLLRSESAFANKGFNHKCFPNQLEKSALKRFNLAFRWLVRNDHIVDIGIWTSMKPSQLYIPLDVHAGNTARRLKLLRRHSNDRKAVEELTALLRTYCPEDPAKYDFALFGIGVNGLFAK